MVTTTADHQLTRLLSLPYSKYMYACTYIHAKVYSPLFVPLSHELWVRDRELWSTFMLEQIYKQLILTREKRTITDSFCYLNTELHTKTNSNHEVQENESKRWAGSPTHTSLPLTKSRIHAPGTVTWWKQVRSIQDQKSWFVCCPTFRSSEAVTHRSQVTYNKAA